MVRRSVWVLASVVVWAIAGGASAQDVTATIAGTVKDASGAVLPGVTIAARNVGTGVTATTVSDGQGRYLVRKLALGDYEEGEIRHLERTTVKGTPSGYYLQ